MIDNLDTDRFAPPLRSSPTFDRFTSLVHLTGLSSCSLFVVVLVVLRLSFVVTGTFCIVTQKLTIL